MINAQTWLQENFPNLQAKINVEKLEFALNRERANHDYEFTEIDQNYFLPEADLEGELELKDFTNLLAFTLRNSNKLTSLKFVNCPKIRRLSVFQNSNLQKIEGLEELTQLVNLEIRSCFHLEKPYGFLEVWKGEIEGLKAQLAEYESLNISEASSDPSEPLNTKIQRKKAELQQAVTNGRKSTAPLRKEIELLEKIQNLEEQITKLQVKESGYLGQIKGKERAIQERQSQITQLQADLRAKTTSEKQKQTQIKALEKQIKDLREEKKAVEERMLKERKEALAEWEKEKANLTEQISQLKEAKDTFQKSADYLRSTLKDAERNLEDTKNQLTNTENQAEQDAINQQATLEEKKEELRQKKEAFKVIQERNSDLQAKLAMAQEENQKLTEWISKLESASAEGDAFRMLQEELGQAKQTIQELEGQLSIKQPKSYWGVYLLLGLVALYFMVS